MIQSASNCPFCHSSSIRRSKGTGLRDTAKMAVGLYPFRCIECSQRFWASIWQLGWWRYAKCPKCLSLTLTTWTRKSHRLSLWTKLALTSGATRYRCNACRFNFASFKPAWEGGAVRGQAEKHETDLTEAGPRKAEPAERLE
jgi:DNA-directed RNA polymerase subunit RPC12/RpoP